MLSLGDASDGAHPWGTKQAEHRLYPAAILELEAALQAAEDDAQVAAVVVTAGGKFFCNGFDLQFLQKHSELADDLQRATEKLLVRILRFPKPTIAAVNGHACAAGAMLMLCFDHVVMNADRGFCFVPGIDLVLTYSPGMSALMQTRLPTSLAHRFIVLGERFTAPSLAQQGVVEPAPPDEVLTQAMAKAQALKPKARHGSTMRRIKATLYHEAIAALEVEPDAIVLEPTFVPMGFDNIPTGQDRPKPSARFELRVGSKAVGAQAREATRPTLGVMKHESLVAASVQARDDLRKWAT